MISTGMRLRNKTLSACIREYLYKTVSAKPHDTILEHTAHTLPLENIWAYALEYYKSRKNLYE